MKSEIIITDQELPSGVLRAIENGRKIEAIKLLREETGIGLANAKVLVDRAAFRYAAKIPSPAIVDEENNGAKLLKMLFLVTLLFALYHFFLSA